MLVSGEKIGLGLSAFRFRLGFITKILAGFLPRAPSPIPSGSGLKDGDGSGLVPSIGTPIQERVTFLVSTKSRGYFFALTVLPRTLNSIDTPPKSGSHFYLSRTNGVVWILNSLSRSN